MSLDPTGTGRRRWSMRWKPALNAFDIAFDIAYPPAATRPTTTSYTVKLTGPLARRLLTVTPRCPCRSACSASGDRARATS
jgi:hypothetical protein